MNRISTAIVAIAACTACCAPVIWPVVAGIGTTGTLTALFAWLHRWPIDIALCTGVAIVFVGLTIWMRRRRQTAPCACESACKVAMAPPDRPGESAI